jgi:hypothetical protein
MITKFKIFENINFKGQIPENISNKIIDALSFIIFKGKKRNENKHTNYKSLRIKSIDSDIKNSEYHFDIEMTNKDKIVADFSKNNIYIKIDDKIMFDLEDEKFDINIFIDKINQQYKNYIENKGWKIK